MIFVDLSLAQIAPRPTMALLVPFMGEDPTGPGSAEHLAAFIGAAVFYDQEPPRRSQGPIAYLRRGRTPSRQSKATSESEHLKDMLVGNILAVSWPEVTNTAWLYAIIGVFHYVFRRRFLAISMNHNGAEAQGASVKWWDFLFYASFGVVVTRSVSIAGVLLVFCYLIVPSVAAMLYAQGIGRRLAIGWTMGTVVSARGLSLSQAGPAPGATMVCTFGLVTILAGLVPAHTAAFNGLTRRNRC